jgi:enediyne biosynthesis protein E5
MKTPNDLRLGALRRFAFGITALNIAGHLVLGFEQSWLQYLVAVVGAWILELLFEVVDARAGGRPPVFLQGPRATIDFLLPAHITGNAVAMLLYPNDRVAPMFLAVAIGLAAKRLFRVTVGGTRRHFLNPSNTGIALTLLLQPSVGIAPPYDFTRYLAGGWDIALPLLILVPATMITVVFTRRVPLVAAWLGTFVLQALVRSAIFGFPPVIALIPMTGTVFVLFTFYMLPDPGTSPTRPRTQAVFGASVALVYGLLQVLHVVFGLFFALALTCLGRGVYLAVREEVPRPVPAPAPPPIPVEVAPVAMTDLSSLSKA